jgi:hypothetical protein
MKVPKSFSQVTVSQYQRISPIYQKIEKESDPIIIASDWCRIISILTDKKPADIEAMPIDKLKAIIKSLNWLVNGNIKPKKRKYLFIKGRLHKAKLDAKQFNTAQYVEIKTFLSRGNWIEEMHNILASIYSPLTFKGFKHNGETHQERAEFFKTVSVSKVYPVVFFYSVQFKDSMKRIQEYGLKMLKEKQKEIDQHLIQTLRLVLEDIGDGTVR